MPRTDGVSCSVLRRCILFRPKPVSYTHLDVYKRQVLKRDDDALVGRNIDAGYTSHLHLHVRPVELAFLVTRVRWRPALAGFPYQQERCAQCAARLKPLWETGRYSPNGPLRQLAKHDEIKSDLIVLQLLVQTPENQRSSVLRMPITWVAAASRSKPSPRRFRPGR